MEDALGDFWDVEVKLGYGENLVTYNTLAGRRL